MCTGAFAFLGFTTLLPYQVMVLWSLAGGRGFFLPYNCALWIAYLGSSSAGTHRVAFQWTGGCVLAGMGVASCRDWGLYSALLMGCGCALLQSAGFALCSKYAEDSAVKWLKDVSARLVPAGRALFATLFFSEHGKWPQHRSADGPAVQVGQFGAA
jgi:hypothetical protein